MMPLSQYEALLNGVAVSTDVLSGLGVSAERLIDIYRAVASLDLDTSLVFDDQGDVHDRHLAEVLGRTKSLMKTLRASSNVAQTLRHRDGISPATIQTLEKARLEGIQTLEGLCGVMEIVLGQADDMCVDALFEHRKHNPTPPIGASIPFLISEHP